MTTEARHSFTAVRVGDRVREGRKKSRERERMGL
jgi:hypothetical protein